MSDTIHDPAPEVTEPGRSIRWEPSGYGSLYGYAGIFKVSLFSISRSVTRKDVHPYRLRCGIPGYETERKCVTEDEAKERAARILNAFVRKVCASPSQETAE